MTDLIRISVELLYWWMIFAFIFSIGFAVGLFWGGLPKDCEGGQP